MGVHVPYYPWFPKDYNSDPKVLAMTDDQDLAYRRMLDASWELGPLPSSVDHLAMIVRYDLERFRRAWRYPLSSCWKKNGHGTIINQRLEDEREAMLRRSEKAKRAVHQREINRSKRLVINGNGNHRTFIERSSSDERSMNDPKPKPKDLTNKRDLDSKGIASKEGGGKRPHRPLPKISWNRIKRNFEGEDLKELFETLRLRYEDLGRSRRRAIWDEMCEWCEDNPEKIAAKKDYRKFILNWFRKDAKEHRERQRE